MKKYGVYTIALLLCIALVSSIFVWVIPGKKSEEKTQRASSPEYDAAEVVMNDIFAFLPDNPVQVIHANPSALTDAQRGWDTIAQFAPATTVGRSTTEGFNPALLGNVSSLVSAYLSFNGTRSVDLSPESPYVLIAAMPTEDLFGEAEANIRRVLGLEYKSIVAGDSEIGYLVAYNSAAKPYVLPLVEPYASYPNDKTLTLPSESFASNDLARMFNPLDTEVSMLYNLSEYFDSFGQFLSTPKNEAFLKTFKESGLGLDKAEDTVWFGASESEADAGTSWDGSFIRGGVNREDVSLSALSAAYADQLTLHETDSNANEENGTVFEAGHFTLGLGALEDALSIATPDDTLGRITGYEDREVIAEGAPNSLVFTYSPRFLEGTFSGYDTINPVAFVTWTVSDDNVSIEYEYTNYEPNL